MYDEASHRDGAHLDLDGALLAVHRYVRRINHAAERHEGRREVAHVDAPLFDARPIERHHEAGSAHLSTSSRVLGPDYDPRTIREKRSCAFYTFQRSARLSLEAGHA